MKNIISFVGFKSSGKNTAADALIPHGYVPFSFADALKDSVAAIFCWDRQMLEGITEESREFRETVDVWWAEKLGIPHFTPRWMMQNFGTNIMRMSFHDDIWILNVERRIDVLAAEALNTNMSVVLTDVRFPNEVSMVKRRNGKVIRIQRGAEPLWMKTAARANGGNAMALAKIKELGIHPSEFAWIGTEFDGLIINDGTVSELHKAVLKYVDIH